MKKLTTALLCLLMVFSCAFCVNAEDATEVLEETPVEVQNETQEAETKVAKIGDVEYATLQEAINVAKNGEEVVLLQDVKEHIRVSDTSNVVLNLNGKTIDNNDNDASTIENLGTLTIKGEGKVLNTTSGNFVLYNRATVVIDGPDFIASKHNDKDFTGIVINEYKATINSGKFTADSNDADTLMTSTGQNAMTINGGVFGNGKLKLYRQHDDNFVLNGGTYLFDYSEMYNAKKFLSENNAFFKNADESYTIKYNKVKLSAYQEENGDLIIKGPENLIEALYEDELIEEGSETIKSLRIELVMVGLGWRGSFKNEKPKSDTDEIVKFNELIKVDSTTLKVNKQKMIDKGFANGKYELSIVYGGDYNRPFECDPVQIITGIEYETNQQKSLTLIGTLPEVIAGKSVLVDKSQFVLLGEDEKPINPDDYDFYWCESNSWDENTYHKTSDNVFKANKKYFFTVYYKYVFDNENDIKPNEIKMSSSNIDNVWEYLSSGRFGTSYLSNTAAVSFLLKKDVVPTVADTIAKIGDKEYASLTEALDNAKNGEEVVILKDVEEDIIVSKDTNAILKVNGKSINNISNDTITNYGTLIIRGDGNLNNKTKDKAIIINNGNLIIDGPTFYGGKELRAQFINTKNLSIEDGTFLPWTSTWAIAEDGKIVINGGVFGNSLKCFESTNGVIELRGGRYSGRSVEELPYYLADGYCFTINKEDGRIEAVKKTETSINKPTLVANKDNLDSVKDTKGLEDIISVGIKLENKKTDELKDEQKKELDTFIKENVNTDVEHHIICLDLKLIGAKNDGTKVDEITEVLAKPLTVSVALSDADVNNLKGKTIKVIRYHTNADGSVEVTYLDAELNGNELTFKTDRFSTYVVVGYRQAGGTTPTPTPTPTPTAKPTVSNTSNAGPKDLNGDGVITCDEEMGSANWIWSESKKACVYKVSNTSVK